MKNLPPTSALAVVGAGPIGLEAAALAASRGWDVVVFEQNEPAHHVRTWGHVRLFSPFSMNHSSWGPELIRRSQPEVRLPAEDDYLTGDEFARAYLDPLARIAELADRIYSGARVVAIGKDQIGKRDWIGQARRGQEPFRLLLQSHGREYLHRCRVVVDASGVYSSPQFLGSGNIPAPGERAAGKEASGRLSYQLPDILGGDRSRFAGRRTLLVGGGHSAATALEAFGRLAEQETGTEVYWLHRSRRNPPYQLFENDPLPQRDRLSRLANRLAAQPPEWLHCLPHVTVGEIKRWPNGASGRFEIVAAGRAGERSLEVDEVVANVGYYPDATLYRQLQLHECYATFGPIKLAAALLGGSQDCLAQEGQGIEILRNPEPNFFILGNKSYGTNNTFLLRNGIEQVATVLDSFPEIPRF